MNWFSRRKPRVRKNRPEPAHRQSKDCHFPLQASLLTGVGSACTVVGRPGRGIEEFCKNNFLILKFANRMKYNCIQNKELFQSAPRYVLAARARRHFFALAELGCLSAVNAGCKGLNCPVRGFLADIASNSAIVIIKHN